MKNQLNPTRSTWVCRLRALTDTLWQTPLHRLHMLSPLRSIMPQAGGYHLCNIHRGPGSSLAALKRGTLALSSTPPVHNPRPYLQSPAHFCWMMRLKTGSCKALRALKLQMYLVQPSRNREASYTTCLEICFYSSAAFTSVYSVLLTVCGAASS